MTFARTITRISAAGSLLLSVALWISFALTHSQLAQAQAADSLMDVLSAMVLAWAVRVAAEPGDARHPFGHRSAEPLGAMLVAAMAAMLAYRVGSEALAALQESTPTSAGPGLAGAFFAKAAFRAAVMGAIWRRRSRERSPEGRRPAGSPAVAALYVDARNDVVLALASLGGAVAARHGYPLADPALALPIALWIGWSGVELAMDNTRLLMGEAPPADRQEALCELAQAVAGVLEVHELRAQYVGQYLAVHLHVVVDRHLTVGEAHDLGERVRARLEAEPDVDRCEVHLDAQKSEGSGSTPKSGQRP